MDRVKSTKMSNKPTQAEVIQEQKVEDMAGRRAMAEPLPGALADAFSLAPDIVVGPYNVRRFRDGDFKLLAALDNPFNDWLRAALNGDETGAGVKMQPTGQPMWDLAFLFTRPASVSKDVIAAVGVLELQAKAEEEFSELRIAALSQILEAIIEQATIYATANIAYGSKPAEGEAAGAANPPSSAAP